MTDDEIRLIPMRANEVEHLRELTESLIVGSEDEIDPGPAEIMAEDAALTRSLADRYEDGITADEGRSLAAFAGNWLDEYHDERDDPRVVKLRAAFEEISDA